MDRVALIIEDIFLYWNSILMVLSAAAAICLYLCFYLGKGGSGAAAAVSVPVGLVTSLFLARLIHWYFRPDGYPGMVEALTDYTSGGYALLGVFLGCGLTAVLLWMLRLEKQLGRMLDAMCLGGGAGIAVGRLACFFSAADRGQILVNFKELPFAYPVVNAVSGAEEYRLATFVIQSAAVGLIVLILSIFFLAGKLRRWDATRLFLLLYCLSQTILDSTRYDSLYMRSNGFISVVQLVSAIVFVAMIVTLSVRMIRAGGFRAWLIPMWLAMAGLMGGAGYMEYYVQRHGDKAVFSYSVMTACLCTMALLALITYFAERRNAE